VKVAKATTAALDQIELDPGIGSPTLGKLLWLASTILAGRRQLSWPVKAGGVVVDFGCLAECVCSPLSIGCLASEARQAVGICRGAVGKPRTPKGPSTGLSWGVSEILCVRRFTELAVG
jgi:hypothetical protein